MYTQINEPKNVFCPSIKEKQGLTSILTIISQMSFPLTRFTPVSAQEASNQIRATLQDRFGQELLEEASLTTNLVATHLNGTKLSYETPDLDALEVDLDTPLIAVNVRGRVLGKTLIAYNTMEEYLEFNDGLAWPEDNSVYLFGKNIFFVEEIEDLLDHLGFLFIERIHEKENEEAGDEAP